MNGGYTRWIDKLSVAMTGDGSRRGILRLAGALGAGRFLAEASGTAATGRKTGKGKGKGKKGKPKPKPKPKPRPLCSDGACGAEPEWAGNTEQIGHCEFICRQCDGDDRREFCILDTVKPDGTPTKKADCCDAGQTCCGGRCCDADDPYTACCDGKCVDTRTNDEHCGACGNPCAANETCILGTCFFVQDCNDPTQGLTWCGAVCKDTDRDSDHCGGCDQPCAAGQVCNRGHCGCPETCPTGQLCLDGQGYTFNCDGTSGPPTSDCHCGCGPHYKYCPDYQGGRCVSPNSPAC